MSRWFTAALLFHVVAFSLADLGAEFDHFVALDPAQKMKLYWTVNQADESISFAVEAATTGWVGVGFSAGTGKMNGADIVIGWVKDGKAYLTDRHGEGYFMPAIDDSQDYELISGTETEHKTILKFSRKINTCDKNDIKIEAGTTRLIFAYNDEDPISETQINKHSYRGVRSILLLNYDKRVHIQPDPNWQKMEFIMGNISIPAIRTSYMCKVFKLPEFGGKKHIVRFEPVVHPGNEGFVHHLVVNQCQKKFPDRLLNFTGNCIDFMNMPGEVMKCKTEELVAAWGVGAGPFSYPKHAGYPIGTNESGQVIIVEIHYDNPEFIKGRMDSSGVRFYYTSALRKYDASTLGVGVLSDTWMIIPPKQKNWIVTGHCTKECTQKALENSGLPEKGIKIFSAFLHTHIAGRGIWTKHIRDGVQLPDIARDNYYDFNFQEMQSFTKEVHFKPGDEMIHQCRYNTLDRTNATYGGIHTTDEMCLNFLMYYPRVKKLNFCQSKNIAGPYKFLKKHFPYLQNQTQYWYNPMYALRPKWTSEMAEELRAFYDNEPKVINYCTRGNYSDISYWLNPKNLYSKIAIDKPYVAPAGCDVDSSSHDALGAGVLSLVCSMMAVVRIFH